jgi:hypothetical protein
MLKKPSSFVLASKAQRTTKSTPCLKTLPAHQLAGAHKRGAPYSSHRAPRCGLAERLFEHPSLRSSPVSAVPVVWFMGTLTVFQRRLRVKRGQDFIHMLIDLHLSKDGFQLSGRIDHKRASFDPPELLAVQGFLLIDAISLGNLRSLVAQ